MTVYTGYLGDTEKAQEGARANIPMNMEASTFDIIRANVNEATKGVGTFIEDIRAEQIKAYRGERNSGMSGLLVHMTGVSKEGKKLLTEGDYKESKYFRHGIQYEEGMTLGEARIKANRYDDQLRNGLIMSKANTAESVVGFTTGLGAAIFEPKNLVSGVVAAGLVRAPLVGLSNSSTRYLSLKNYMIAKTGERYGEAAAVASRAGIEGAVAVAITEPSNIASARLVGDDYTMTDSLMNLVTSIAFGAALEGGGVAFRNMRASKQMKIAKRQAVEAALNKLKRKGVEFSENVLDEIEVKQLEKGGVVAEGKAAALLRTIDNDTHAEATELASQQLMAGQVVDVEPVGIEKTEGAVLTPAEFTDVVNSKYGTEASLVQRENDLYLASLKVAENERGQGIGKSAMQDIIDYADKAKQAITVTPTAAYGADLDRLTKFYEGFGFVKDGNEMVRKPNIAKTAVDIPEKVRAINESLNNPKKSSTYDAEAIKTVDDYNKQYSQELDDEALQREIDEVGVDIDALRAAGFIDDEMDLVLKQFDEGIVQAESFGDSVQSAAFCLTRG